LLRIEQIKRLIGKTREKGLTLVPLSMYLKENKWAKVELALVKGKAKHDKREAIAERDAKRAMEKTLKQRE
jgi:SsrA-binding protein